MDLRHSRSVQAGTVNCVSVNISYIDVNIPCIAINIPYIATEKLCFQIVGPIDGYDYCYNARQTAIVFMQVSIIPVPSEPAC